MKTLKSLCIATALASGLLLGAVGPAAAADPFEVSERNCIKNKKMDSSCLTTNEQSGAFPVQLIIDQLNTTIEKLRRVNGWGKEVTPDTIIPIGSTLAFG
jgi:hypothetical protein